MGEEHLNPLTLAPRLLESRGAGERTSKVAGSFVHAARDLSRRCVGTASRFKLAGTAIQGAAAVEKCRASEWDAFDYAAQAVRGPSSCTQPPSRTSENMPSLFPCRLPRSLQLPKPLGDTASRFHSGRSGTPHRLRSAVQNSAFFNKICHKRTSAEGEMAGRLDVMPASPPCPGNRADARGRRDLRTSSW